MKDYSTNSIINLSVAGHASTGKTMLCESILLNAKKIRTMGNIDSKTTVSDFHNYEHNNHLTHQKLHRKEIKSMQQIKKKNYLYICNKKLMGKPIF